MPKFHADATGVLIGVTGIEETLPDAVTTLAFDAVSNQDLLADIYFHTDRYRLLPGPELQKDGQPVTVDTTPVPTGIRRAIQILTEQEARIQAAANLADIKAILEQDRVILRRMLIRIGEDL